MGSIPVGVTKYTTLYIAVNSEKLIIRQEFISKYKFNTICLKTYVRENDNKINYKIKLLESDKVVKEYIVNSDLVKADKLCLMIDAKLTKKNTKYTIVIEPGKGKDDSLRFANISYRSIDVYDGNMYINGDKQKKDLVISVYNRSNKSFMSKQLYLFVVKCLVLMEVLTYIGVVKVLVVEKKGKRNARISRKVNGRK